MKRRSPSSEPPRLAAWIVPLFTPAELSEAILGDLHEEYLQLRLKAGGKAASRWYNRHALQTIVKVAASGFRGAPLSTTIAVVGGFLLLRFVHALPDKFLLAITDRYLMFWSGHFQTYLWVLRALPIEYFLGSVLVGFVVALAAKGREMIVTLTLGFILCAMAVAASVWIVAITGDTSFLWNVPLHFTDPLAIVIGGAVVRRHRSVGRLVASA